ncbi:hypothetical protein GCM10029978_003200 [Actinoallomurus acanthiterrae]
MDTFAFGLLGFFLIGYFVLAGADIGVGMLLPFLGRERRLTIATIAPFFLGNEVWLVGSVGLLTALFPVLEADLFGRTWGALSVLVPAWIVRDMGLWLRGRRTEDTWRTAWDAAIVAGSWGVAASWGVAIGALMGGGGPLFAVTTCGLFALHGAVFATVRLGTETARTVARWVVRAALLAGVPCVIGAGADDLATTVPVAALLAAALAGVWVALARPAADQTRDDRARDDRARDDRTRGGWIRGGQAQDGHAGDSWARDSWARDDRTPGDQARDGHAPDGWARDDQTQGGHARDGHGQDGWARDNRTPGDQARDGQARGGWARDGWALAASALAITAVPVLAALNLPDAELAHEAALTLAVVGPMTPLLVAAQAWVWWIFRGRVEKPSYL